MKQVVKIETNDTFEVINQHQFRLLMNKYDASLNINFEKGVLVFICHNDLNTIRETANKFLSPDNKLSVEEFMNKTSIEDEYVVISIDTSYSLGELLKQQMED